MNDKIPAERALAEGDAMTIKDSTEIFKSFGKELEGFYVEVYKNFIDRREGAAISNSNYLHALQLTTLMMRNTGDRFHMFTGSSLDSFFETLGEEVRRMLNVLQRRGKKASIIVVNPPASMPAVDRLRAEYPGTLEIIGARSEKPSNLRHYIVADNNLRDEEPHDELTEDSRADLIQAKVIFNDRDRADRFANDFATLADVLRGKRGAGK